ncbi:MAG: hypothetical protein GF381_03730 [Candidatus Pacebacteria bacterium]|nr:hypothetical protein [Candidatus Paceibacterota bacterium]
MVHENGNPADDKEDQSALEGNEADENTTPDREESGTTSQEPSIDERYADVKTRVAEQYEEYIEEDGFLSEFLPVYRVAVRTYLIPIAFSLIIAGILAYITYEVAGLSRQIPEDSPEAGLMNGLFFVLSAVISSVFIAFIVKKRGENALKYLMAGAFLVLTFFLIIFFADIAVFLFNPTETFYYIYSSIVMVISGILSVTLIYMFFTGKMGIKLKNAYVLTIGILIGAFMGTIMPTWTAFTLLIGISLWDIYSVNSKRGPIRQILESTGGLDPEFEEKLKSGEIQLVDEFSDSELEIGVGDIAFYSLLVAHVLTLTGDITSSIWISLLVSVFTAAGVLLGAYLTISALKKNKILPGLPLSIFIGSAVFGASIGIYYLIENFL